MKSINNFPQVDEQSTTIMKALTNILAQYNV